MTWRIEIMPGAFDALERSRAWWRANRPEAPNRPGDEFAAWIDLVAAWPRTGRVERTRDGRDVRVALLRGCRLRIYYVLDETVRLVSIVAILDSRRGDTPGY